MSVTVVIPALNEAGNIGRLVEETFAVVPRERLAAVIVIDDGSTDATGEEIKRLLGQYPTLRYLRHAVRCGQSAAIRTGVLAAASPLIATMDGDGQNDPRDIPRLLARLGEPGGQGPALVGGIRVNRKAAGSRRLASAAANRVRKAMIKDGCPDSGCGIKVYWRESFLRLPYFTSMHRFMPALFLTHGHKVDYAPVNDRPRLTGQSKYTNAGRLFIGFYDMIGVIWLRKRTKVPQVSEDLSAASRVSSYGPRRQHAEHTPRQLAGE